MSNFSHSIAAGIRETSSLNNAISIDIKFSVRDVYVYVEFKYVFKYHFFLIKVICGFKTLEDFYKYLEGNSISHPIDNNAVYFISFILLCMHIYICLWSYMCALNITFQYTCVYICMYTCINVCIWRLHFPIMLLLAILPCHELWKILHKWLYNSQITDVVWFIYSFFYNKTFFVRFYYKMCCSESTSKESYFYTVNYLLSKFIIF